jgi:phosphoenolpyruvate carboxylase
LRDDVRTLGALVGDVIREQCGDAFFQLVERARHAAIAGADDELQALVKGLPPRDAETLVRAFSAYFEVVNLAERIHRIRRRRDYLRSASDPQEGSLQATVAQLAAAGVTPPQVAALLQRLLVEPVFTAHPTEATRRTLLEKEQVIGRLLVERLDPSRTPDEERAALARIREEITAAWQTDPQPSARPTVMDELENVLFYLTDIVYRIVPPFSEELEQAVHKTYAVEVPPPTRPVLRFGSWVGGDMDGNPNVGAETLRAALARQRDLALDRYRGEATELARRLSQSGALTGVSDAVRERIATYSAQFPKALAAIPTRYHDMPYRVLCRLIAARLEATRRDTPDGYGPPGAVELERDLGIVIASLRAHRGEHAGLFAVQRLLRRVETFGFHLATIDLRQHAHVHREVLGTLLSEPDWSSRPAAERLARLRRVLEQGEAPPGSPDALATRTLEVFQSIAECRARYGPDAVGPYIISMTQGADDVLAVLVLARWGGLAQSGNAHVPLDVAPLFETVTDLAAAPEVMRELLADSYYRAHLADRGGHMHQMIMIGYSDSNKDAGIGASRWALHLAQAVLVETTAQSGVDVTFFHGRGGTVSRGGGRITSAILSAPPGSIRGRYRMTEQGEAIDAKYGLRGIAMRTLEQTVSAVVLATALPRAPDAREPSWTSMMEAIARESRAAYRALVYDDAQFVDYFTLATPIDVIQRMEIGSRPASRPSSDQGEIEQLRAIPWVFAWTQSRHLLPGWYGLGTALDRATERFGAAAVGEMARKWPFLRALIDDVEMVLATADLAIAARYGRLAGKAGERYLPLIRAEFDRTVANVLALKRETALLDSDPALQRSILLRNPYVDPMSLLQVDLLERWRAAGRPDNEVFRALLASVRGIAQGLQSTG